MAVFPGAIATDTDLYLVSNNLGTVLTAGIDAVVTTVPVVSTTGFPTTGWITIDQEAIQYTGLTGTSFTGCTRGAGGTVAASHLIGAGVKQTVVAAHHNSLKDEIKAVEQFISDHIGLTTNVSAAEFEFLDGITTVLPISKGGTNSSNALTNNKIIKSQAGEIVEHTAITNDRALVSDANGIPTHSVVTTTELGYVSGVTSLIQTQLGNKASTALSNLSSVAINTTLVSDTNNTDDLGTSSIKWKDLWTAGIVYALRGSFGTDNPDLYNTNARNLIIANAAGVVGMTLRCNTNSSNIIAFTDAEGTTVQGLLQYTHNAAASNETLLYRIGGLDLFTMNGSGQLLSPDGSASLPTYSYGNDPDTGHYRDGTNRITLSLGATPAYRWEVGAYYPVPDASYTLGQSTNRWTTVYATNGTINTSHSSTKSDIVDIDPNEVEVPRGVKFFRDGRNYIGYLNDNLPVESRPIENGKVIETMNYESSVVGVLCAAVRQLQNEIKQLKMRG